MSFLSSVKDYLSIAVVENNRLLRENVLLKERIAQLESRPTQRAPDVCPDCKGKGIVKDGFGQLFECARCQGSGQRR